VSSPLATNASGRPLPAPPRPYAFPSFERLQLSNGIELVVAPVRKLPIVTVLALVDAGAVVDPAGKEGLAQLTAQALAEGTERSNGAELAERFEQLGAAFDASADWDATVARLTVTADRLPAALELFAEVLRTPAFPQRDIERLKAERLAELMQLQAEPRGLADEMFSRLVYAAGSRYALPDGGTTESVSGLTRDDVAALYAARFRPAATTIVIAGDVSVDAAVRLTNAALGSWSGEAPDPVVATDGPAHRTRRVHLVRKEDAPQSELRIGHVGLPRSHPDYFPVVVMNAILGGLFSSRINLNLREANAYTYGAFSSYEWRRGAGPFTVSTAVKTDVTDAAVREVLHEIDRMRTEPVSAEELSLAVSYLDGVFPIRYETTASIASALANLVLYRLRPDYYDRYREDIRGISAEDVLRAAREHLHPDRMQVVLVGDPATVRTPVSALELGELAVYDAEGHPIG
jgi:zinc protease